MARDVMSRSLVGLGFVDKSADTSRARPPTGPRRTSAAEQREVFGTSRQARGILVYGMSQTVSVARINGG